MKVDFFPTSGSSVDNGTRELSLGLGLNPSKPEFPHAFLLQFLLSLLFSKVTTNPPFVFLFHEKIQDILSCESQPSILELLFQSEPAEALRLYTGLS